MKKIALLSFFVLLSACGGGSGGGSGGSSSPTISNGWYSPTRVYGGGGDALISLDVDFFDADGDIVGYQSVDSFGNENSGSLGASGVTSGAVSVSFYIPTDAVGDYTLTFNAVDSAGNPSNKMMLTVSVVPQSNAGEDRIVTTGEVVNIGTNRIFDVHGAVIDYKWIFLNKPALSSASIDNFLTANGSFYSDANGEYEIQLTVNDGQGNSDTDIVTITSIPPDFFTLGSNKDDVMQVQGAPTSINSLLNWWYYGTFTKVEFSGDKVDGWDDSNGGLKSILIPGNNTTNSSYIALGSHKDDVIRIQGTPTEINSLLNWWYYGTFTKVEFSGDKVDGWNNYNGSLILQ